MLCEIRVVRRLASRSTCFAEAEAGRLGFRVDALEDHRNSGSEAAGATALESDASTFASALTLVVLANRVSQDLVRPCPCITTQCAFCPMSPTVTYIILWCKSPVRTVPDALPHRYLYRTPKYQYAHIATHVLCRFSHLSHDVKIWQDRRWDLF